MTAFEILGELQSCIPWIFHDCISIFWDLQSTYTLILLDLFEHFAICSQFWPGAAKIKLLIH